MDFGTNDPTPLDDEDGLPFIDLHLVSEMDAFGRSFPGLFDRYLIVDRIGEGTFSTVYKAIDIYFEHHNNDAWLMNSLQEGTLEDILRFEPFINNTDWYSATYSVPMEKIHFWKSKMEEYIKVLRSKQLTPFFVALKRINKTSSPDRIYEEISFVNTLREYKGIVSIVSVLRHEDQIIVVTPYFQHTDFRELMNAMTTNDIRHYMYSLLDALTYVHKNNIMHRDLKPSNFLYSFKHKCGLLVDFGLAQKFVGYNDHHHTVNVSKRTFRLKRTEPGYYINDTRPQFKASRAGTRGFRAPEVLFKHPYQTTSIDMWSVGVIFLTILTRQYPFFNSPDDAEAIVEIACIFGQRTMADAAKIYNRTWICNVKSCPEDAIDLGDLCRKLNPNLKQDEDALDLLKRCLDLNANTRITASEALDHPFLSLLRKR